MSRDLDEIYSDQIEFNSPQSCYRIKLDTWSVQYIPSVLVSFLIISVIKTNHKPV